MKRLLGFLSALVVVATIVYVMAKGFGTDPHEVPFMLTGKKAPEFRIKRLDTGDEVALSTFAGKPVVLNFWATWCGPCKSEHPVLDWAAKRWANEAVFLGIVFEDTEENTKRFLAENGASFTQLFDPKSTVSVDYGVSGVPETYFINRQGIIVRKHAGPLVDPREFEAKISEILRP
jgi:cytochrome c biogenesis protein CcmG/thiol:disulfide interchange protein DsbE